MLHDRCGYTDDEIAAFRTRWYKYIRDDCTWDSFEEFLKWTRTVDFTKGAKICKIYDSEPFGPDNTYIHLGRTLSAREATAHEKPEVCRSCTEETASCALYGCAIWKEWFVKNWNENIHVDIPAYKRKPKKIVFQYEHPDRVRERLHENQN